jgi:hypothetical protein
MEELDVTRLAVVLSIIALFPAAMISIGMAQRDSATDPRSLIGQWHGEWSIPETGSLNRVYITVKSVSDDGHVAGTIYLSGPAPYHNKDLKLVDATFRGGRFIFLINENRNLVFDFTVKGNEMTAILMGTAPMEFVLKK